MPALIATVAARAADPTLFLAGMAYIYVTGLVLLIAAGIKFLEHARHPEPLAKASPHFFSTREMVLVVLAHFPLWLNSFGQLTLTPAWYRIWFAIGALAMTAAILWHIAAKFKIRHMWSDGIEIKRAHTLVTTGPYALARHPMYASLLLWCWGAGAMMASASLILTTALLLPLMIVRARAEEAALGKADPDYFFYRRTTPMLTPKMAGVAGVALRIAAATLFAYGIVTGMNAAAVALVVGLHVWLGFSLKPEKIGFSYVTKSGMMTAIWAAAQFWPPAAYLNWLILAIFVYGLFFNCPCMLVYERYHGCPCVGLVKRCLVKR